MTILAKLRSSLRETPRLPRDAAMAELALSYATLLDQLFARLAEPEAAESATHHRRVIAEIDVAGRRLEAVLNQLGMSPGARPAVRGGDGGDGGDAATRELEQLRADAATGAAGIDYAAAVDPSVTAADAGD